MSLFNQIGDKVRLLLTTASLAAILTGTPASADTAPELESLAMESGSGLVGFTTLSLSPSFSSGTNTYSASIPFEHTSAEVVTGTSASACFDFRFTAPASFPAGAMTPITIEIVDQDPFFPSVFNTYTINITREESNDNAALSSLVSSEASLTPTFASLTFQYTALVGFDTTEVSLTPTALQPGSTIMINDTPVEDEASSAPISLALGDNQVVVLVTSEDLSVKKGYEIIFTRLEKDSDGDGMEDGWELDNNLLIGTDDSLLDKDSDGLLNIFEFAFGSNPCDPVDAAHPVFGLDGAGFGTISFFKAIPDGTLLYSPEVSTPNESWSTDLIDQTGAETPQNQVWRDNAGGASSPPPARWMRVRVTPNY